MRVGADGGEDPKEFAVIGTVTSLSKGELLAPVGDDTFLIVVGLREDISHSVFGSVGFDPEGFAEVWVRHDGLRREVVSQSEEGMVFFFPPLP